MSDIDPGAQDKSSSPTASRALWIAIGAGVTAVAVCIGLAGFAVGFVVQRNHGGWGNDMMDGPGWARPGISTPGPGFGPGGIMNGLGGQDQPSAVAMQRGTITAISGSAITIKSTNGYTATYVIDGQTNLGSANSGGGMMGGQTATTNLRTGDAVVVFAQGGAASGGSGGTSGRTSSGTASSLTARWVVPDRSPR